MKTATSYICIYGVVAAVTSARARDDAPARRGRRARRRRHHQAVEVPVYLPSAGVSQLVASKVASEGGAVRENRRSVRRRSKWSRDLRLAPVVALAAEDQELRGLSGGRRAAASARPADARVACAKHFPSPTPPSRPAMVP